MGQKLNHHPTVQGTLLRRKIITIKEFKRPRVILKKQKKLSPMMNEKTLCNTLFDSPCIMYDDLLSLILQVRAWAFLQLKLSEY